MTAKQAAIALADTCADCARQLLKAGDAKSARSWLQAAQALLK